MGFFILDDEQELSQTEICEIAKEMMEKSKSVILPDFIKTIQLNNFDDDYLIKASFSGDAALMDAYKIRRKYNKFYQYVDAVDAYNSYIEYIENLYGEGSFEIYRNSALSGLPSIYIPFKPKLTNKKKNKALLAAGIVPSRVDESVSIFDNIDEDAVNALHRYEVDMEEYTPTKEEQALIDQVIDKKSIQDRLNSIYVSDPKAKYHGTDAIIAYITSTDDHTAKESVKKFSDYLEESELEKYEPEMTDEELQDLLAPSRIIGNMLVDRKKQQQVEILEFLEKNGYPVFSNAASYGVDKRSIRAIIRMEERDEVLTPAELKKRRKKEAKKRKRMIDKERGDSRMFDALLNNRVSYSSPDGAIDFRLGDVFK